MSDCCDSSALARILSQCNYLSRVAVSSIDKRYHRPGSIVIFGPRPLSTLLLPCPFFVLLTNNLSATQLLVSLPVSALFSCVATRKLGTPRMDMKNDKTKGKTAHVPLFWYLAHPGLSHTYFTRTTPTNKRQMSAFGSSSCLPLGPARPSVSSSTDWHTEKVPCVTVLCVTGLLQMGGRLHRTFAVTPPGNRHGFSLYPTHA